MIKAHAEDLAFVFCVSGWSFPSSSFFPQFTFLLVHYYGVRKLEFLFAALVGIMTICFAVCFGISKPDGGEIIKGKLSTATSFCHLIDIHMFSLSIVALFLGFLPVSGLVVPYCSSDTVVQAVGTLGAVIMPHNLYLHSALGQNPLSEPANV